MVNELDISKHDDRDPNPWLAMYLDSSIPMNEATKRALMRDNNSRSARYLLPFVRFFSKSSFKRVLLSLIGSFCVAEI